MPLPQSILNRILNKRERVKVQFLSRPGCHLCDEAEPLVRQQFGTDNVETINILEHSYFEGQYVFRIPVILFDGRVIAEGVIGRREAHLARRAAIRSRRGDRKAT